ARESPEHRSGSIGLAARYSRAMRCRRYRPAIAATPVACSARESGLARRRAPLHRRIAASRTLLRAYRVWHKRTTQLSRLFLRRDSTTGVEIQRHRLSCNGKEFIETGDGKNLRDGAAARRGHPGRAV